GTVNFMEGATVGATGTLTGGTLNTSTSTLSVGTHTLFAHYVGTTNFAPSDSSTFTVTVTSPAPVDTTTMLSSNNLAPQWGQSVTFTATVTAATGPAPTSGTVSFRDNGTEIGTGTVGAGGVATYMTSSLSVGPHPIPAFYLGTSSFNPSTSNTVNETVSAAATTTTASGPSGSVTEG